jgi:4-diphosphocytidyl-2-C-methyl-D-erythritol kinase
VRFARTIPPTAAKNPAMYTELAKAKVNLTLEVRGKRADGYHELSSIVAFSGFGDTLEFTPGAEFSLETDGPMAAAIDGPNLIEKTVNLMRQRYAGADGAAALGLGRYRLTKRIPVAAGLGGGSSDAAAAIRAMLRACPAVQPEAGELCAIAAKIGADVPVCLEQQAALMAGIGEKLIPLRERVSYPAVLANPGVKLSTRDVFTALAAQPLPAGAGEAEVPQEGGLRAFILRSHNSLEAPARRLSPVIGDVLAELAAGEGCWLARLSGSGATCFGLYATAAQAEAAAASLQRAHPDWLAVSTTAS